MKNMLIVGLGNPGEKYQNTRHNVGYIVIDYLDKGIKTKTFMNQSGKAIKKLISNFQFPISNLWVVHDDIDIPVGQFKIQKGRGAAGHKGVQSIINELGTKNFWRIRVGICPLKGKPKNVQKFVLQNFTKDEIKTIKGFVQEIAKEMVNYIK